ncbi:RDD family protein [Amycolatopsis sp. NPDC051371]|uniref:RDD family protein n=1 Tax=Amycolatopsis sp. NPDC051371 TaxID=3155800 RepID=UPI00341AFE58
MTTPGGGPRPTTWRRWGARWIDWLLPWLIGSPLWFAAGHLIQSGATEQAALLTRDSTLDAVFGKWGNLDDVGLAALSGYWSTIVLIVGCTLTLQVLLVAAYEVVFVYRFGRTPGKMAFSLTVVRAGTGGALLPLGNTFRRTASAVVLPGLAWVLLILALLDLSLLWAVPGVLLLVASLADCLALRATPEGRTCWHDRRAGSVVVPITWGQQLRQVQDSPAAAQLRATGRQLRSRATGDPVDDTAS